MVTVRESIFIKFENGVSVERMELEVDSAEELPSADFMQGHLDPMIDALILAEQTEKLKAAEAL